jgi:hypothetical protein
MNNCYRFEKILIDKPVIFKSIDATYIIHLEGNGRIEHIMIQLSKITPSKIVYIVFNKGYKKCKKESFINTTNRDLVDANIKIFTHSNEMNYNNILILEDDFIFEDISENDSIEVDKFLIKNKNKDICYLIGSLPFIIIPTFDLNHWKGFFTGGMHSVIYTKQHRINILKMDQSKIKDWDKKDFFKLKKYVYKKPLCFQTFPITNNRKNWHDSNIMNYFTDIFINTLNLDKKVHPGYDIMYVFAKYIIPFVVFFIILNLYKKQSS